ncbi:hypothetical protein GGS23DRAFT_423867 [Durotheca rogersii]|uniref:uncharacterized protein n=1 Tax=Durotheca rogersii TaxID=419775 RepID=UPI002220DA5C|nr:uncharacterized protein GGS23DRAFT_423867 [Durotheca rogersii]KAI5865368.1 hypothetical protein GGS23DRAFT_423867 [Durotheca rogersii]
MSFWFSSRCRLRDWLLCLHAHLLFLRYLCFCPQQKRTGKAQSVAKCFDVYQPVRSHVLGILRVRSTSKSLRREREDTWRSRAGKHHYSLPWILAPPTPT